MRSMSSKNLISSHTRIDRGTYQISQHGGVCGIIRQAFLDISCLHPLVYYALKNSSNSGLGFDSPSVHIFQCVIFLALSFFSSVFDSSERNSNRCDIMLQFLRAMLSSATQENMLVEFS